jgi:hypothetical protein
MAVLAACQQRWQRRGRALATAWRRQQKRSGGGGGGVRTPAVASMAEASAAWHQHGVSGGGTINNQLKALAAMASETATMTATTMTIKTKATAAAAAAWRQRGGGRGGRAAGAEAKAWRWCSGNTLRISFCSCLHVINLLDTASKSSFAKSGLGKK